MKKIKYNHLLIYILLIPFALQAQDQQSASIPDTADYPYWIEMMQDPSVNFYDVQSAFNIYWKSRPITKGCGWKPFKRWEYMKQSRVLPNGDRRPEDHTWNEYFNYLESHPNARSANGDWINLGPFHLPSGKGYKGLGRLNAIAFHPTDPNTIFVGAPSGGLWQTYDCGNTWISHTDDLPTLGVSTILLNYNNPDIILIGTGDRDAADAVGLGVMISTDGGVTWSMSNNGMGNRTVGRLIMHPTNTDIIYAAAGGGVFKSTDGGDNWVNKVNGNFKDIVFKPDDPSTLYATANGDFYRSTDDGETWDQITNGLPSSARGVIGVTPADPDYVYFLMTNSQSYKGTYRSTDAGLSFSERSTTPNIMSWGCEGGEGGQAWYDLDIAIDPLNENIVYAGGVNCFKSINGGITWEINSHWWGDCGVPSVHADLHVFEYNPVDGRLYAGNDGGIYWTDNGGTTWPEITDGMPISQVYKIGQSATERNKVINGYQDNGTSTYMGDDWVFTRGGDGMECIIDHKDAIFSYASLYFGSINRYYNNNYQQNVASNGNYGIDETGAWITPYILDEIDEKTMFIGYKNVWRCYDVRAFGSQIHWDKISDNLAGSNSSNMAVLEQSPANINILYAARYDKKLFRTDNVHDQSPTWTNLTNFLPNNSTPTDLEAHPNDPNIVYMTQNNKVYKSVDMGLTWEDISGTLPDVHLSSIIYYLNSHEGLYIGSDAGVFYKDEYIDDWIWFNNGLPADASVNEIEIFYDPDSIAKDVIRAGTYGRGMWESDLYFGEPAANFIADQTLIPTGCGINFTDLSSGIPHEWSWHFEGGQPETSNEKNPTDIVYDIVGTYSVTLKVTNPAGSDSVTFTQYITVSDTILPDVNFVVNDSVCCYGEILYFTDLTEYCPYAWQWMFNPDNVIYLEGTNEHSQNPIVTLTEPGDYSVTLIAENSNGQESLSKTDYILYGGFALPFSEDFEDGFATRSWVIVNPDYDITWGIHEVNGNSPGNQAAWMNFFDYYSLHPRDMLISPVLDFSGFANVSLFFQHAYAQRFSQVDSLIIFISDDCGDNWTRIFEGAPNGSGAFATSPPNNDFFVPETPEDWCGDGYGSDCNIIDLTQWSGSRNIKLKFETDGKFGNNLYLDNIFISNSVSTNEFAIEDMNVLVYPNPSSGIFNFITKQIDGSLQVSVLNIQGQVVYENNMTDGSSCGMIDLSGLSKGIYLLKFTTEKFVHLEKIMIK